MCVLLHSVVGFCCFYYVFSVYYIVLPSSVIKNDDDDDNVIKVGLLFTLDILSVLLTNQQIQPVMCKILLKSILKIQNKIV